SAAASRIIACSSVSARSIGQLPYTRCAGELGWNALALPEAAGGLGLGAVEQTVLMEQLGRRVACVPYFSTACLAATALAGCREAAGA
ncbi:acyl-CoA dehydrogenase family protein, partial [Burkholderia cenocepacia]